jgi:non-heme chloroperoxidase
MRKSLATVALATICAGPLSAQDIAGTWQGTIDYFGSQFRQVLKVSKGDSGWHATLYSIDEGAEGSPATSVVLHGATTTFTFAHQDPTPDGATYEGTLDSRAHTFAGTYTQPDGHWPLKLTRVTPKDAWAMPRSHDIRFIAVDTNVKLEILDWGGSGRPVVFLTGLGVNAHAFDLFAPKFTPRYHVYGVTRRGFGASSKPTPNGDNYTATRLSDDVLAVLDSLHLTRPILVGHSIAGEELSAIGSRHPDRVAGLIYLDAGYPYAFYDTATGSPFFDPGDLRKKLDQLSRPMPVRDTKALLRELLESDFPRVEHQLRMRQEFMATLPDSTPFTPPTPDFAFAYAIEMGTEKFTAVHCPVLAIFAVPHNRGPRGNVDSTTWAKLTADDSTETAKQANAFEAGIPSARVVRIRHASHYVFNSNEPEVEREMNAFMAALP